MTAELSPVPRNATCPCGSGRRYKDCHGSIAATPVGDSAPANVATCPTYRPSGADWDHLSDADRDFCGALMQRALKQQCTGRLSEAAANYAKVVARAPNTHDALHMLGAIELRRGNFTEAKRLIRAALALRPPYPDIEHNLRMVEDLERAERVDAGRPSAPPEVLCERALPALVHLALRPRADRCSPGRHDRQDSSGDAVHLIAGVEDSNDDAAWLVRRLAALLGPKHATVWGAAQARGGQASRLACGSGDWPDGGHHVYVGLDVDGDCIDHGHAERVVVFCAPAAPSRCLDRLRAISRDGARAVELVFPSRAMAARFGSGHAVLPPPIVTDLASRREEHGAAPNRPFTAGLIGRHFQGASPSEDADFLHRLAAKAGRLEIYDPGVWRYVIGGDPAVRCRSRSATALREFLRSIDCLVHPVGNWWQEGDGRELFMAMAAGIPIVCPYTSIFAEYIDHGVDGVLYGVRADALMHVAELRRTSVRCAEFGRAARSKIAALVAPERAASSLRRLLFGEPSSSRARGAGVAREPVPAK